MYLKPSQEIIGTLVSYEEEGDQIKLVFSIKKQIEIPKMALLIIDLNEILGELVGLLNYSGSYKIRIIKKSNKKNILKE